MGLLSLLAKDPVTFLITAALLLYSVIAHEVAHGWTAGFFGDDTAQRAGRLTANPLPHIDPMGVLMLFVAGFGWARPVPVDYDRVRRRSRFGLAVVSLAGPLTNVLIAAAVILLLQSPSVHLPTVLIVPLKIAVKINIVLAAFNLIPLPPLDGSKIVGEFLPFRARLVYVKLERVGFFVLVLLLMTGILNPVITFMERGVTHLILWALHLVK